MFFGSTRSAVTTQGSKPSVTLAAFKDLTLNIAPGGVRSVEHALEEHTASEHIADYEVRQSFQFVVEWGTCRRALRVRSVKVAL